MKACFTFDEIREIEGRIIENEHVPSILLMENAGKNACDLINSLIHEISNKEIFILCGKGNNAGDGFTLARHLSINNVSCSIVLLVPPSILKGDAAINYALVTKCPVEILEFTEFIEESKKFSKKKDIVIIDAILGTGIKGLLDEQFLNVITLVNKLKGKNRHIKIISLDIPSGLMSGEQLNPIIKSDYTISMGTYKTELMFGEGKENRGDMNVVPIGISENLLQNYNTYGKYIVEPEDIQKLFPVRKKTSHKYSGGKVLIIGGSKGLSGAVIMSAISALKSGAGAVTAAIPDCISTIFNRKLFEVMTVELDSTNEGTIRNNQIDKIQKRIDWADVVLLGPGISTNSETRQFVLNVVENITKPLVIDADGLNNLSQDLSLLKRRKNNIEIFLTPHLGEFSRLINVEIKDIQINRFELIKSFAQEYNVYISLKSETTVSYIKTDNHKDNFYINSSGNQALATAGSGDVLSGIIASLYAQTKDPFKALICGNYIHGFCADLYVRKFGNKQTAVPQDLINYIPKAISNIID